MILTCNALRSASVSRVAAAVAHSRSGVVLTVNPSVQRFYAAAAVEKQILNDDDDKSRSDDATRSPQAPFMKTKLASSSTISKSKRDLDDLPITFADISRAEVAIRGGVKRTSCEQSHFISELVGARVFFKNEFQQFTGSFKERGARNAILKLKREKKGALRGCIAASAGNHALALAYHGQQLGVPVTVVMPVVAPMSKVDKCRVSPCPYPYVHT